MNVLDLIAWWFALSLVAGLGLGRLLDRAEMATVPVERNVGCGAKVTGSPAVR